MRELLILFGVLIGWVLGYVFQLYMPKKKKEEGLTLQRDLNEAKDTIRRLEARLGQYQNLQEQLNACETQRLQQTDQLESIRAKFTSAEAQIETLQQRLRQYQSLQEQLNTCENQLEEKTEELEGISAKLTSAETQIETLQQRLASLEQKIQAETAVPPAEAPSETKVQTPPIEISPKVETKIPEAVEIKITPTETPQAVEAELASPKVEAQIPRIVEPEAPPIETSQAIAAELSLEKSPSIVETVIESEVEAETPSEESLSATEPETEPEPESVRSTPEKSDNLRKIEGIGPKVAQLLNEAGILTFEQLAQTEVDRLRVILEEAGGIFKAMDPASWPEQAGFAAKEDWKGLQALQDQLDGGRYKS